MMSRHEDRAGKRASPLTHDELSAVFEAISTGQGLEEARRRLPTRDRVTVARAYNVVLRFEGRSLATLDDKTAAEVAEAAGYSATAHYVQELFIRWRAWKADQKKTETCPDAQLGRHRRELFYFAQRLRERLIVRMPEVAKELATGETSGAAWEGRPDSSPDRPPLDAEELSVEEEWGHISYDARSHSLFHPLRQHLDGHPSWPLLDAADEAIAAYAMTCHQAYEAVVQEVASLLPDLNQLDMWNMARALLLDGYLQVTHALGSQVVTLPYRDADGFSALCRPESFEDGRGRKSWSLRLVDRYYVGNEVERSALRPLADAVHKLDARMTMVESIRLLGSTYFAAQETVERFKRSLWPDSLLRKLIQQGHCDLCSD
jgi:hypothetical protein